MKVQEMRSLTADELELRVGQWEEELFRARCNKAIGQLNDTSVLRDLRRRIARARTLINEMQRQSSQDAASQS